VEVLDAPPSAALVFAALPRDAVSLTMHRMAAIELPNAVLPRASIGVRVRLSWTSLP
jgi:hypothetical protein